eukprot:COSAG02_NODE_16577_length_1073_cov_1.340862_2_plen_110_part_01
MQSGASDLDFIRQLVAEHEVASPKVIDSSSRREDDSYSESSDDDDSDDDDVVDGLSEEGEAAGGDGRQEDEDADVEVMSCLSGLLSAVALHGPRRSTPALAPLPHSTVNR